MGGIERIIIKVGSSSLCNDKGILDLEKVLLLAQQIAYLKRLNKQVVLVSSGAIATGMGVMGLDKKPEELNVKQALAAIGQTHLMHHYEVIFNMFNVHCAQILVNHEDFKEGQRLNHLQETMDALLAMDVVPIVNENDALAVEEIKVGDNDTLASLFVPVVKANLLVLISDIDGLYNKNPTLHQDAFLIPVVDKIDASILAMVEDKQTKLGTGGMQTKINAAITASIHHCHMVIMNSKDIVELSNLTKGPGIGTWFRGR